MDAVQDLPEQGSAEMRHDIDNTRSALADKLEALEDKMIDTVQSAQDTVKESIQSAKDTVASVKRTFDIKHQVDQRPWTIVGGCFLAGWQWATWFPLDGLNLPSLRVEPCKRATASPLPIHPRCRLSCRVGPASSIRSGKRSIRSGGLPSVMSWGWYATRSPSRCHNWLPRSMN